jgi:hypothetical protein
MQRAWASIYAPLNPPNPHTSAHFPARAHVTCAAGGPDGPRPRRGPRRGARSRPDACARRWGGRARGRCGLVRCAPPRLRRCAGAAPPRPPRRGGRAGGRRGRRRARSGRGGRAAEVRAGAARRGRAREGDAMGREQQAAPAAAPPPHPAAAADRGARPLAARPTPPPRRPAPGWSSTPRARAPACAGTSRPWAAARPSCVSTSPPAARRLRWAPGAAVAWQWRETSTAGWSDAGRHYRCSGACVGGRALATAGAPDGPPALLPARPCQEGVRAGMRLTAISDPIRRDEVWKLQDRWDGAVLGGRRARAGAPSVRARPSRTASGRTPH